MNLPKTDVCYVIGTRAQLVKLAPVILASECAKFSYSVWLTGQHSESMQELLRDFGIRHDHRYFGEFSEKNTVASLLCWTPSAFARTLRFFLRLKGRNKKTVIVVHGDTLSALIGALAGRCTGLRVAHIESGLSSGRLFSPFPEELIRRVVFRFANIAYCPNVAATKLMNGFRKIRVVDTRHNTILDSVRAFARSKAGDVCGEVGANSLPYIVVSIHRFENIFDDRRLLKIVDGVVRLSARFSICFVLHPSTRKRLDDKDLTTLLSSSPSITLTPRMSYSRFLKLMAGAAAVVTDGGSNQEELAYLGVPTILLRRESERPDGLGCNILLEDALDEPFEDYLLKGLHEDLRAPMSLENEDSPSKKIVEDLETLVIE